MNEDPTKVTKQELPVILESWCYPWSPHAFYRPVWYGCTVSQYSALELTFLNLLEVQHDDQIFQYPEEVSVCDYLTWSTEKTSKVVTSLNYSEVEEHFAVWKASNFTQLCLTGHWSKTSFERQNSCVLVKDRFFLYPDSFSKWPTKSQTGRIVAIIKIGQCFTETPYHVKC